MWRRWGLAVGVLLTVISLRIEIAASFSVQDASATKVKKPQRRIGTPPSLHAVGIPLDDSVCWSPRTTRIHSVLQKAQRRTGLDSSSFTTTLPRRDATSPAAAVRVQQQPQVLPFCLPALSDAQKMALEQDEIVMEQSEMGRQGSGFVVQDVRASEETVWDCLLDFERYPHDIHTVRAARVRHSTTPREYGIPSVTRASFDVSRFQFTISAIFHYQPHLNYMELSLDNAIQSTALQSAKGYWYTERLDNDKDMPSCNSSGSKTRVWLLCDLTVSPLLPSWVVDVAAQSAMPRASSWLRPTAVARHGRREIP